MNTYSLINVVFVIGVILAPIVFISMAAGFVRSFKNDKRDSFEISSALQNSMFSMMTTMIMGMQRGGVSAAQQQQAINNMRQQQQTPDMSNYENWNVYQGGNMGGNGNIYYPNQAQFQLQNARASVPYQMNNVQTKKSNGFLVGLLSGLVVLLVLALVIVLGAKF